MRRPLASVVLVLFLGCVLAVTSPGPANGLGKPSKVAVKDAAGDAPAAVDLVSGRYAMTTEPHKRVKFSVRVADLSERTFLTFEVVPLAAGKDRFVVFRENGRTVGRLYADHNDEDPETLPRRCKRAKVSWDAAAGRVTAELPFTCLVISQSGSPGAYVFRASSRVGGVAGSPTDSLPERTLDF